jgi:hypothetical protein
VVSGNLWRASLYLENFLKSLGELKKSGGNPWRVTPGYTHT